MPPQIRASILSTVLLRGVISGSGLSHEGFAAKVGISPRTLTQLRRGWQLTARITRRIEAAMGCAIWASREEFARQQAITAWLGFDPWLVHYRTAAKFSRDKGFFDKGSNPSKALVFARLVAAFDAAHPAKPRRGKRAAQTISTVGNSAAGESTTTHQKRTT